jgi:hypothetical protein
MKSSFGMGYRAMSEFAKKAPEQCRFMNEVEKGKLQQTSTDIQVTGIMC